MCDETRRNTRNHAKLCDELIDSICMQKFTPNRAEYGSIHADIGPFLDIIGPNAGPKSMPGGDLGATAGCRTAPSAEFIAGAPPGRSFSAP